MILYAIILHICWATSALFDAAAYNGTAFSLVAVTFGWVTPFVLYSVAASAFAAFFVRNATLGLLLQSPQQYVLALSAIAVSFAVWSSHFADGVIRSRAFIFADQVPAILAFCGHTVAIMQMAIGKKGMKAASSLMTMLITAAVVGPLAWIVLDRTQPVARISGVAYSANGGQLHPGDTVTVDWTIEAKKSCDGSVRRQIVDGQNVTWDFNVTSAVAEAGGPYHLIRDISIPKGFGFPKGAQSATARYHAGLTWRCNFIQWLWPLHAETNDVSFTVYAPLQPQVSQ